MSGVFRKIDNALAACGSVPAAVCVFPTQPFQIASIADAPEDHSGDQE
jgi:hypothetical protein